MVDQLDLAAALNEQTPAGPRDAMAIDGPKKRGGLRLRQRTRLRVHAHRTSSLRRRDVRGRAARYIGHRTRASRRLFHDMQNAFSETDVGKRISFSLWAM